jgi:hypothetical protein
MEQLFYFFHSLVVVIFQNSNNPCLNFLVNYCKMVFEYQEYLLLGLTVVQLSEQFDLLQLESFDKCIVFPWLHESNLCEIFCVPTRINRLLMFTFCFLFLHSCFNLKCMNIYFFVFLVVWKLVRIAQDLWVFWLLMRFQLILQWTEQDLTRSPMYRTNFDSSSNGQSRIWLALQCTEQISTRPPMDRSDFDSLSNGRSKFWLFLQWTEQIWTHPPMDRADFDSLSNGQSGFWLILEWTEQILTRPPMDRTGFDSLSNGQSRF